MGGQDWTSDYGPSVPIPDGNIWGEDTEEEEEVGEKEEEEAEEEEEEEEEKVDQSDLISAINDGRVNRVQELLERGRSAGIYLNRKSPPKGETPLTMAVKKGNKRLVDIILDYKPSLDEVDNNTRTALHVAAWNGSGPIAEALLDAGANPRVKDPNEQTPLHFAAHEGRRAVVYQLMNHGARLEARDKWDFTALHYAAQFGHLLVVKDLVDEWGAEVGAKTSTRHSPRSLARNKGHTQIVNFLNEYM